MEGVPDLKYALIDSDVLVYRVGHASNDVSEAVALQRVGEWMDEIVGLDLELDHDQCQFYITGKTNFRFDVAVTQPYKGNRTDLQKPKHYKAIRDYLQRVYKASVSEGEEADDAIAKESVKRLDACWIVHQDKDLDQLQGWHYNPVKRTKYYVTSFEGLKNFYTQLLTGDRVDNIKGLEGIGPAKAFKILEGCKDELDLKTAVLVAYEKQGKDINYLNEQGQLLWLRRYEGEQLWTIS